MVEAGTPRYGSTGDREREEGGEDGGVVASAAAVAAAGAERAAAAAAAAVGVMGAVEERAEWEPGVFSFDDLGDITYINETSPHVCAPVKILTNHTAVQQYAYLEPMVKPRSACTCVCVVKAPRTRVAPALSA